MVQHSVQAGAANRLHQFVLIVSTFVTSWLSMQAVHESGHVLGAWLTGGRVVRVLLHPLKISRTNLAENPRPLIVVWSGPVAGVTVPLIMWCVAAIARVSWAFLLRFFAGFCLLANGLYIGLGSFSHIGDCGEMLRHGSRHWHLWLFGILTAPAGLFLWHRQGRYFGLGSAKGKVSRGVAYGALVVCLTLLALGFLIG